MELNKEALKIFKRKIIDERTCIYTSTKDNAEVILRFFKTMYNNTRFDDDDLREMTEYNDGICISMTETNSYGWLYGQYSDYNDEGYTIYNYEDVKHLIEIAIKESINDK